LSLLRRWVAAGGICERLAMKRARNDV
jgi:hypothetical protein